MGLYRQGQYRVSGARALPPLDEDATWKNG